MRAAAVHESYPPLPNRLVCHGGQHPVKREAPRHVSRRRRTPILRWFDEFDEKKKETFESP